MIAAFQSESERVVNTCKIDKSHESWGMFHCFSSLSLNRISSTSWSTSPIWLRRGWLVRLGNNRHWPQGQARRIKMRKNISQGVSAGVPSCQCHWFEYDRARNKRLLTTELLRSGSILNHISLSGLCKLNFKSRDESTLGPLLFSFGLYSSLPCISTHKNASVQKPCCLPKYQQPVYH